MIHAWSRGFNMCARENELDIGEVEWVRYRRGGMNRPMMWLIAISWKLSFGETYLYCIRKQFAGLDWGEYNKYGRALTGTMAS
jgi:hypothetical protein